MKKTQGSKDIVRSVNGIQVSGDFTVTRTINGQTVSIYYDKNGFPDFRAIARQYGGDRFYYKPDPSVHKLSGTSTDMTGLNGANAWALRQNIPGFVGEINSPTCTINGVLHTWHHHQDGLSMFPVPSNIHTAALGAGGFSHIGGKSIIGLDGNGLQGLFDSPNF